MDISFRVLSPDDLEIADNIITSAFGFTGSRAREIRRYFAIFSQTATCSGACRPYPAGAHLSMDKPALRLARK